MTDVKIFTPVNRLRDVLSDSFGETREELVLASTERVQELAPRIREQVAANVARLASLRASGARDLWNHTLEIEDAAMAIAELAGAGGQPRLGEVARGALAIVPSLAPAAQKAADAMLVHLGALELIAATEPEGGAEMEAVVANLAAMRRTLGLDGLQVSATAAAPRAS